MTTIGTADARTCFSALLRRASKGETFQITRRGVPIAKLVPAGDADRKEPRLLVRDIRVIRKGITLGDISIRELINQGRR